MLRQGIDDRMGQCRDCGKHTWIQNKTKMLCSRCVYIRNHNGKNKEQVYEERSKKKTIYKSTGERELFKEIWDERRHQCVNCGKLLYEPKASYFAHKFPKSTHPHLRLTKENIMLLCYDCHYEFDFKGMHKHLKSLNNETE